MGSGTDSAPVAATRSRLKSMSLMLGMRDMALHMAGTPPILVIARFGSSIAPNIAAGSKLRIMSCGMPNFTAISTNCIPPMWNSGMTFNTRLLGLASLGCNRLSAEASIMRRVYITPLGFPVVPDEYIIIDSVSALAAAGAIAGWSHIRAFS